MVGERVDVEAADDPGGGLDQHREAVAAGVHPVTNLLLEQADELSTDPEPVPGLLRSPSVPQAPTIVGVARSPRAWRQPTVRLHVLTSAGWTTLALVLLGRAASATGRTGTHRP